MFNGFVGLPYRVGGRSRDGVDCWGLIRLVFADRGIELPVYDGDYVCKREAAAYAAQIAGADWTEWRKVYDPEPLDMIAIRRAGYITHVGLVVRRGLMLHADEHGPSRIESYDAPLWKSRIAGFYRHASL